MKPTCAASSRASEAGAGMQSSVVAICTFHIPQQVGDVIPDAHHQTLRNPSQAQRRLRPQPAGEIDLVPIVFASRCQFAFRSTSAFELLGNHAPGPLLTALKSVAPVMVASGVLRRRRQQVLPKGFAAPNTSLG
jgi:hypothetical protein